jgi:hypothetical protein
MDSLFFPQLDTWSKIENWLLWWGFIQTSEAKYIQRSWTVWMLSWYLCGVEIAMDVGVRVEGGFYAEWGWAGGGYWVLSRLWGWLESDGGWFGRGFLLGLVILGVYWGVNALQFVLKTSFSLELQFFLQGEIFVFEFVECRLKLLKFFCLALDLLLKFQVNFGIFLEKKIVFILKNLSKLDVCFDFLANIWWEERIYPLTTVNLFDKIYKNPDNIFHIMSGFHNQLNGLLFVSGHESVQLVIANLLINVTNKMIFQLLQLRIVVCSIVWGFGDVLDGVKSFRVGVRWSQWGLGLDLGIGFLYLSGNRSCLRAFLAKMFGEEHLRYDELNWI